MTSCPLPEIKPAQSQRPIKCLCAALFFVGFIAPQSALAQITPFEDLMMDGPMISGFDPVSPEPEPEPQTAEARGVIKAAQTAEIGASMAARLTRLPYKPGQYFKKGALLARFDCQQQEAEAKALEHALAALTVKHDNVKELLALGAAGDLEESMASADTARAGADLMVAKARLKNCAVYAPYAGSVKTRYVSNYDSPSLGSPLYSIIRAGRLEIDLIAPSAWMRWMKSGETFEFTVDETGQVYTGKIVRLGAAVDPVSQTIEVTAKFTRGAKGVLPGMSGVARFTPPSQQARKADKVSAL